MATDPLVRFCTTAALCLAIAIALPVPAASADPHAELKRDLMFSPNPDVLRQEGQPGRQDKRPPQSSGKAAAPDKAAAARTRRPAASKAPAQDWLQDWHERMGRTGAGAQLSDAIGGHPVRTVTPVGGASAQNDWGSLGRSSVQFRTEKQFQTPEPFRRTDCSSEEECADYSPFPKSRPSKTTAKNVRKPFLGLSITTPIH